MQLDHKLLSSMILFLHVPCATDQVAVQCNLINPANILGAGLVPTCSIPCAVGTTTVLRQATRLGLH